MSCTEFCPSDPPTFAIAGLKRAMISPARGREGRERPPVHRAARLAAVLAFAVTAHLATILYAVRGGLTAGEVLAAP